MRTKLEEKVNRDEKALPLFLKNFIDLEYSAKKAFSSLPKKTMNYYSELVSKTKGQGNKNGLIGEIYVAQRLKQITDNQSNATLSSGEPFSHYRGYLGLRAEFGNTGYNLHFFDDDKLTTEIDSHVVLDNQHIFVDSKLGTGNHIQDRIAEKRKEIGVELFQNPITILEVNISKNNYKSVEQIDESHYICYIG